LNVSQIEPVIWNKKAFDRLVLDPQSKELIKALVSVHLSTNKMGDIITGKGNGLIILLHGSPGVGKTLTAESYVEVSIFQINS
jgi:ATP-dependent Lon protease